MTPQQAIVADGATQRFVATGTFADATSARLSNATLAAGGNHTCAIARDGTVRCWGQNGSGQIGNGGQVSSPLPVAFALSGPAVAVSAGSGHKWALL